MSTDNIIKYFNDINFKNLCSSSNVNEINQKIVDINNLVLSISNKRFLSNFDKDKIKKLCISKYGLINNNSRKHLWLKILGINYYDLNKDVLYNTQEISEIIDNDVNRSIINKLCSSQTQA